MFRIALHLFLIVFLTLLTQLGGIAWLAALGFRRRVLAFVILYTAFAITAQLTAPLAGRTALPCLGDTGLRVLSPLTCALNRQYVSHEMRQVADDLGQAFPNARALDGNFPFLDGFPLLPHLSHDDGDKLDLAFIYQGLPPSPIGYWAFEDGASNCPRTFPSLRWDMGWLQQLWRQASVDAGQTAAMVSWLSRHPEVGKILLEPHLTRVWNVAHPKVRFQGCHAARHDDHIHFQLAQ